MSINNFLISDNLGFDLKSYIKFSIKQIKVLNPEESISILQNYIKKLKNKEKQEKLIKSNLFNMNSYDKETILSFFKIISKLSVYLLSRNRFEDAVDILGFFIKDEDFLLNSIEIQLFYIGILNNMACCYFLNQLHNPKSLIVFEYDSHINNFYSLAEKIYLSKEYMNYVSSLDYYTKIQYEVDMIITFKNFLVIKKQFNLFNKIFSLSFIHIIPLYYMKVFNKTNLINNYINICTLLSEFIYDYLKYIVINKKDEYESIMNIQLNIKFLLEVLIEFILIVIPDEDQLLNEVISLYEYYSLLDEKEELKFEVKPEVNILDESILKNNSNTDNDNGLIRINIKSNQIKDKYIKKGYKNMIILYKNQPIVRFMVYIKSILKQIFKKIFIYKKLSSSLISISKPNKENLKMNLNQSLNILNIGNNNKSINKPNSINFNMLMEQIDKNESSVENTKFQKMNNNRVSSIFSDFNNIINLGSHFGGITFHYISKLLRQDKRYFQNVDSSFIQKYPKVITLFEKWMEFDKSFDKQIQLHNYINPYFRVVLLNNSIDEGYFTYINCTINQKNGDLILNSYLIDNIKPQKKYPLYEIQPLIIEYKKIMKTCLTCSILLSLPPYFSISSLNSIYQLTNLIILKHAYVNLITYSLEIKLNTYGVYGNSYYIDFLSSRFLFDINIHYEKYLNMYLYNDQIGVIYFDIIMDDITFKSEFTSLNEDLLSLINKKKIKNLNESHFVNSGFIPKNTMLSNLTSILPKIEKVIETFLSTYSKNQYDFYKILQKECFFKLHIENNWELIQFWYLFYSQTCNSICESVNSDFENMTIFTIQFSVLKKISLADTSQYIQKFYNIKSNDFYRLFGFRIESVMDNISIKDRHSIFYILINIHKLKDIIFRNIKKKNYEFMIKIERMTPMKLINTSKVYKINGNFYIVDLIVNYYKENVSFGRMSIYYPYSNMVITKLFIGSIEERVLNRLIQVGNLFGQGNIDSIYKKDEIFIKNPGFLRKIHLEMRKFLDEIVTSKDKTYQVIYSLDKFLSILLDCE